MSMVFLPYLPENLDMQRYLGESMVNVSQSSLPLKEGYVLFYSKYSVKVFKFHSRKRIGENIYSMDIFWNIL